MPNSQTPQKPLSEFIKKARSVNSLTQAAFGKLFHPPVAQPTVARWEKGEQIPDQKHFLKIASLLNLKLEELFELVEGQLTNADSLPVLPNTQTYTPNQRHIAILNRGALAWNRWREKNPEIIPQLAGASPREEDLDEIDLRDADLRSINLNEKSLRSARFDASDLREANLIKADLSNANLEGTDLRKANLPKVNLSHANLRCANLSGASLRSANLGGAKLIGANLSEAMLRDANFNEANLTTTNLNHADLTGADLRCAVLNQADFKNAVLKSCLVYGISAWDIQLDGAVQEKLNICQHNVKEIYVKSLSSAYVEFLAIAQTIRQKHD